MITASQRVINEIISPVRDIHARVELYKGSTLVEICNCNDRLIKFDIERIGDESKFFGFGICQRVNVHFIDKARELNLSTENTMKIAYRIGEDEFIYPYPTFHISEVRRDENTNELSITGYDLMYPDTAHIVSDMALPESYNLNQFVTLAATALNANGVVILNEAVQNSFLLELPQGGNYEGNETIREALNDVAEATQTIYYINSDNQLVFKRLDKDAAPALAISKADYITLESRTNRRLAKICHATELGENIDASLDSTGSTQFIRENGFWTMLAPSQVAALLEEAISVMGGITINQFDCSWRGNFLLEIGDKIAITTKDDNSVNAYVIDDTVVYNGAFSENTGWSYVSNEEETPSNPSTIGDKLNQTFAKVDKVNREIELLASKIENSDTGHLVEEIAQIKVTTENITQRVSKIEKGEIDGIETIKEDVAELKITTNSISQEVNNMKTTIDDDITNIEQDVANIKLTNDSITQRVSTLEQNSSAGEITNLKKDVAELQITTQGITQEVSRVEQTTADAIQTITNKVANSVTADDVKILIQQEVTEGVDVDAVSVTTETGYVFNKDGLLVSKSNSELTTQITDDGMTVRKNTEVVLSADSEGVYATNLHATTYLLIGGTSRFEDYDGDTGSRTGCFWIGR